MGCRLRQNVRLRSANRGNGNNTWNMNTGGNVNNNNAYNANRCCPDCAYNARDETPSCRDGDPETRHKEPNALTKV